MSIKLIECPRDAMQGIKEFIPTELKVNYLNKLLQVGFDTLDFGSFVSPKAIPQMQDTAAVLEKLDLSSGSTRLLAIVANIRGAEEACKYEEIDYLGFPFSISETFQQRNTNTGIEESIILVQEIQNLCLRHNKQLVVYISMAFGNPYNDPWNSEIVITWANKLHTLGVRIMALSDTIGVANPENISYLFSKLIPSLKEVEFGAHFHSRKESAMEKIKAAYEHGCRRFDSAIHGFGGCPMAKDDLTGNIPTETLELFLDQHSIKHKLNKSALETAYTDSWLIFNNYH